MLPMARTRGLVIKDVLDETLVYDLERHRAHCLNRTAALVWGYCDGGATVEEMVERLQQDMEGPANESVVWLALERLSRARLLVKPIILPAAPEAHSRRALLRKIAIGVVGGTIVIPAVQSIVAPTVAMAASCGTACTGGGGQCAGFPVCNMCQGGTCM